MCKILNDIGETDI